MNKMLKVYRYTEEYSCETCGKLFIRNTQKRSNSFRHLGVKRTGTKNCSTNCSRIYNRNHIKIRRIKRIEKIINEPIETTIYES